MRTRISLHICAIWSESLLTAWRCFSSMATSRASNEDCVVSSCALKLRAQAFFMRTAKTLIRLGGCPGWTVFTGCIGHFAGSTCHFVGFIMRWLILFYRFCCPVSFHTLLTDLHSERSSRNGEPMPSWEYLQNKMSIDMTKPTKWLCAQRRLRSAWASTQSDQSLRCALNG